jgi:class 3 adenylate cyclase
VLICAQCGEENPDRARFCLSCAAPFDQDAEGKQGSRKVVSAVICDVTGSTELEERLDPESVKAVMDR